MRPTKTIVDQRSISVFVAGLGVLVLGAGCRTRLNPSLEGFTCDQATGVCTRSDGGADADASEAGDADGAERTDADARGSSIVISAPTSPTYTNGVVAVQVSLAPGTVTPAQIELLKDDAHLATLTSPFAFSWDTTAEAEGNHSLTARATIEGDAVVSPTVAIIVDRTPPTVVPASRVPAPSATEVVLAAPIRLSFSEPISPSSAVNAVSLSQPSGAIATTSVLSTDGKSVTATIDDKSRVALSATAPLALTAGASTTVKDLAGNALVETAQWSWTVPLWLDFGSVRGESPSVALDAKGEPSLSTAFEPGAIGSRVYTVQVSQHDQGSAWKVLQSSPQTANSLTLSAGTSIVVGGDGLPTVAWSEQPMGGPPASIHVARWTGSGWDASLAPLDAVQGTQTDGYAPSLAFGPANALVIAWAERGTNSVTDVYAAKAMGNSWMVLPAIGVIGANAPALRVDQSGQPIVSWIGGVSSSGVSTWTGSAWATTNFPSTYSSSLALDKTGRPVVAFVDGSSVRVRYVDANAEEYASPISAPSDPQGPRLAIDSQGRAVVAWSEADVSARVVKVMRWTGSEWDTTFGVLDALPAKGTDGAAGAIAIGADDLPIVVWQESDPYRKGTYARKSNR